MMFKEKIDVDYLKLKKIELERKLIDLEKRIEEIAFLSMQPDPDESKCLDDAQYFSIYIPPYHTSFTQGESEKIFRAIESKTIEDIESMNIELDKVRLNKTSIDQESFLQDEYEMRKKICLKMAYLKTENREHEAVSLRAGIHEDYIELKKNWSDNTDFTQAKKTWLKRSVSQWRALNQRHREERGKSNIELLKLDSAYRKAQLKVIEIKLVSSNIDEIGLEQKSNDLGHSLIFQYDQKKSSKLSFGQLTFDAEGSDSSCRQPHWPGGKSGVTIGHGYDLKHRTEQEVVTDLKAAGFPESSIEIFSMCCIGLEGEAAHKKVAELKNLNLPDATPKQQKKLFEISYPRYLKEVKRICADEQNSKVARKYKPANWDTLDPRIKEVLVDLTFVGHYVEESREHIQPAVVKNDFETFKAILENETLWTKKKEEGGIFGEQRKPVAPDRFKRRVEFLNKPTVSETEKKDPSNSGVKQK